MDYKFAGPRSSTTGSTSPLQGAGGKNIETGARKWVDAGLSWEKLVLGVPGYGRAWIMKDVIPLNSLAFSASCNLHIPS
jgi:GH18 family chitinase